MTYSTDSFYISDDNKAFVKARVEQEKEKGNHRYNKSNYIDDLLTHLRLKAEKQGAPTKPAQRAPSNFDEQFELLWTAKLKKGSKKNAKEKYRNMSKGSTSEVLEQFTQNLINDIDARLGNEQIGFEALHLTTYLSQERWNEGY